MSTHQRIVVVDPDTRRRAELAKLSYDAGIHVEPCQNISEVASLTQVDGPILCYDAEDHELITALNAADHFSGSFPVVIAYSVAPTAGQIVRAMLTGAINYLEWPIDATKLRGVLELADYQRNLHDLRVKQANAKELLKRLSARELDVVRALTQGHSNKGIARILGISHRTAEVHRASAFRKLELNSTSDAVRLGVYAGLDQVEREAA